MIKALLLERESTINKVLNFLELIEFNFFTFEVGSPYEEVKFR